MPALLRSSHSVRTILLLYLCTVASPSTGRTSPRFTVARMVARWLAVLTTITVLTTVRLRITEPTLAATRTHHKDMDTTHGTPCTPQLWRASTATSLHRDKHLNTTTTHGLDADNDWTCYLASTWLLYSSDSPEDEHDETSETTPRRHLSHQQSSTAANLQMTTPCCLLRVAPPSDGHLPPLPWRRARRLHPVAPPTDNRPPQGASSRLPRASVASDLRPCSDTNCWNSLTNQSHEAIRTHAKTTFYRQACVSHALIFSLYFFFSWYNSQYKTCWTSGVYKYTAGSQNLAKPTQTQSPITTPNQTQTANTCFLLYYYDKDTWLVLPCTNLETNQTATARTLTLTQLGPEYLLRKDYFQQWLW
jgi:hypothetical protein